MAIKSNQVATIWGDWNGSGTVSVRDSYGLSSIGDNGAGNYTMNFSADMSNNDYLAFGNCSQSIDSVGHYDSIQLYDFYQGTVRVTTWGSGSDPGTKNDCDLVCAGIIGSY